MNLYVYMLSMKQKHFGIQCMVLKYKIKKEDSVTHVVPKLVHKLTRAQRRSSSVRASKKERETRTLRNATYVFERETRVAAAAGE